MRLRLPAAIALALLAVGPAAQARHSAAPAVVAYPSSQTLVAGAPLPAGGRGSITLAAARGDHEHAWLVVRAGGEPISASIERGSLGDVGADIEWGHYVAFGARRVPDALLRWDGSPRAPEEASQALFLRVFVPRSTAPGTYTGAVKVTVAGETTTVPLTVRVHAVTLPLPGSAGSLHTSFHVNPQSYVNAVARVHGLGSNDARRAANASLFRFLAAYGIAPASWGFGEPRSAAGYASSGKWWLDSAGVMTSQVPREPGFGTMRIPVSSNRTAQNHWIAGLNPAQPETWCDYLKAVREFWAQRDWLTGTLQYLYAQDEPGAEGQRLVARQSKVVHECWPGSRTLMTGNPERANAFLWDGKSGDDVDIWTVLVRRHYGRFTVPREQAANRSRAREFQTAIARVRDRAQVWSYTYTGVAGTPGFTAAEPLSNPRMLMLWNALEAQQGFLYGQGTTNYGSSNPLVSVDRNGEFVLFYPGAAEPIPSARLEQVRDGIEDWAVLALVRQRWGVGAVRSILGKEGLFSASAGRVALACRLGCELKSETKFSWPTWSRDASTPRRIEAAHATALARASAAG